MTKLKFSRPGILAYLIKIAPIRIKVDLHIIVNSKKIFLGGRGLHCPFLWVGINCLKATESLWGDNLLFPAKFPEIPGTHLIDLVDPPIDLEHGTPIDRESSALTTRPLLQAVTMPAADFIKGVRGYMHNFNFSFL